MKRKIFSILFALVLVVSFSLVTAVPASAAGTPTIDAAIGAGEWDGAVEIPVAGGMGTVKLLASTHYLYVLFDVIDTTDARLGQNLVGNDKIGLNINPTPGGPWGKPYDIVFQTGADPAAFTTVPPGGVSSGMSDSWYTEWVVEGVQLPLPPDLETMTIYSGGTRISEWKVPLATIGPSIGDTLLVGGACDNLGPTEPAGGSFSYPPSLVWDDPATYVGYWYGVNNEDTGLYYQTIQDAIDAASGTTLVCALGVYNEDVTINKSLTLISAAGKDNTTINGQSTGWTGAVVVAAGISDVFIGDTDKGFTVNGSGQAAIYALGNNDSIEIRDNKVVAANGKNALLFGCTGGGQSNHTIADNEFSGAPASQLVYVNGQASLGIASTSVDFMGNTFAGTATGPALGQEAADSTVSGNTFATVTGYASLELWVNNTVTGNDFSADLPAGGIYVLDNTGFGPGIPGGGVYVLDIAAVLANNTFLRAVIVDHPGASLLPAIWANIQDAVYEADTGDTVTVQPGTYDEDVDIETELTLCAAVKHEAVVEGTIMIDADEVTVDGFSIEDFGWGFQDLTAIVIWSSTDVVISNNLIDGAAIDLDDHTAFGIFAASEYGAPSATLEGNTIINVSVGIISMVNYQLLITGNTIDGATISGIGVRSSDGTEITYNDIINNRVGIRVFENGVGVVAHFNNIHGNTDYGIWSSGPTVDATNNYWCSASGPSHSPGYGDPVSDDVLYNPWLLGPVVPGEPLPTLFDKTLALNIDWTLVSTNNWIDPAKTVGVGVIAAINYTPSDGWFEVDPTTLVPVNALYLKTVDGGALGIIYSGGVPVASSKELEAGWNLISSATGAGPETNGEGNARDVLSPLRYVQVGDEQGVGLATLVSQGSLNQHSPSFYLATLGPNDWNVVLADTTLNPFDGYWAYMNAGKTFGVVPGAGAQPNP